jgi:hypothetical protein
MESMKSTMGNQQVSGLRCTRSAMLTATLVVLFAPALPALASSLSSSQSPIPPDNSAAGNSPAQPPAKKHAHSARGHAAKAVIEPTPIAEIPAPDPPPPDWPVNAKPELATVGWNGRDLKIDAANSSLQQILKDVSTATGVQVEGLASNATDERIYGSYGPAPARDVLGQLLDGAGYNLMMIGDQGEGTPRQLVLTAKNGGTSPQGQPGARANQNADEDAPEDPEPPEQPEQPVRRPMRGGPPGQNRMPPEVQQELQQRQQQLQQQQPGAPVQPPNAPPNN